MRRKSHAGNLEPLQPNGKSHANIIPGSANLPADLIQILADDEIERRRQTGCDLYIQTWHVQVKAKSGTLWRAKGNWQSGPGPIKLLPTPGGVRQTPCGPRGCCETQSHELNQLAGLPKPVVQRAGGSSQLEVCVGQGSTHLPGHATTAGAVPGDEPTGGRTQGN